MGRRRSMSDVYDRALRELKQISKGFKEKGINKIVVKGKKLANSINETKSSFYNLGIYQKLTEDFDSIEKPKENGKLIIEVDKYLKEKEDFRI